MRVFSLFLLSLAYLLAPKISAQDWVHTGTNLGNERIRLAAADFKPVGNDPGTAPLKAIFDSTLYSDLTNAGIFDMVSKSLAPQSTPGSPQEFTGDQWSAAPASAAMVAFGALSATNGRLVVYGWLTDARTAGSAPVLASQYNEAASQEMARTVEDILARRTRALFLNAPAALRMAERVAQLMARELGQGAEWEAGELQGFRQTAQNYVVAIRK